MYDMIYLLTLRLYYVKFLFYFFSFFHNFHIDLFNLEKNKVEPLNDSEMKVDSKRSSALKQ